MPRIARIEDAAARGELADLYGEVKAISPTGEVDDVIRCLSLRPDFLAPSCRPHACISPMARLPKPSTR